MQATEAVDVGELLCNIRVAKDASEIATIKRAIWVMEESLRRTLALIPIGMTEQDVVAELEYQIKKLKAQGPSFSTIVLAGEKAALPHGDPGDRVIAAGEVLLIDAGIFLISIRLPHFMSPALVYNLLLRIIYSFYTSPDRLSGVATLNFSPVILLSICKGRTWSMIVR
ncbi:M24 family metallopeptidase [Brevibacillus formosus]|uniref:M24 family metallopeptidase n=1 Tax=Brevibacillus formosus TaxID=54913 RepID=UPI001F3A35FE|nr:M24 family metallopeptidase [Brevibacillus formosus]